jgi:hypothetical protein
MEASEYQTSPFVKDDVKMETDIDSGPAKISAVDDVRISMDTFSANEKEEQK